MFNQLNVLNVWSWITNNADSVEKLKPLSRPKLIFDKTGDFLLMSEQKKNLVKFMNNSVYIKNLKKKTVGYQEMIKNIWDWGQPCLLFYILSCADSVSIKL